MRRASLAACLLLAWCAHANAGARIERGHAFPRVPGTDFDAFECVDSVTRTARPCPDVTVIDDAQAAAVVQPYERADFDALEATFARWRDGGKQFDDGSWELALYLPGLTRAFTNLTADSAVLASWQKRKPGSLAAQIAQAQLWYVYALRVKGNDPHAVPGPEAQAIAAERLNQAAALLRTLKAPMRGSPLWYELAIAVARERAALPQARALFAEGSKRFPRYHPLYLSMSEAYTGAAFDTFAGQAVALTRQFEGSGMYARLYLQADRSNRMRFDPQRASLPGWPRLRAAYEDLLQRYPDSIGLATSFASAACRAEDSPLYRQLRSRADVYLLSERFILVPVEACDRRHGWTAD
ncbi:DUF4034 domain-containing protein [Massilia sp. CF038]|uniref:DUF4034 domain-containing protein n=1 Tax=Massilia sp. CF038 TaxID=1881045 RepID=UPI000918D0F2|nr:DUF4034 domain-containing protein [Massilia sp. CF038]SHH45489.1 protein of unknown function [Massilia sp. CF038]